MNSLAIRIAAVLLLVAAPATAQRPTLTPTRGDTITTRFAVTTDPVLRSTATRIIVRGCGISFVPRYTMRGRVTLAVDTLAIMACTSSAKHVAGCIPRDSMVKYAIRGERSLSPLQDSLVAVWCRRP